MDGQADTAPVTADDVAAFLIDNPDADGAETNEELTPNADAPEGDEPEDNADAETDDESPDDDGEDDAADKPDPTSTRKFKVTIKGDDGADVQQDVDEKELIAGYTRHSDYTRKTQELARREEQAVEVVRTKVTEAQNHYVQQAQMAQALVAHLAGMKSPEEMQHLAVNDPAAYVAESARAQQIQHVIGGLQNRWQQEQFQQQQQQQQALQKSFSQCWGVLGNKGIDKPKLQHIFETVSKDYGIDQERFATLNDPAVVLVMRDAVAYRELQKKTAEVKKKAASAPRLPPQHNVPRNETRDKRLSERLRTGRGSRDDLASFIAQNNL